MGLRAPRDKALILLDDITVDARDGVVTAASSHGAVVVPQRYLERRAGWTGIVLSLDQGSPLRYLWGSQVLVNKSATTEIDDRLVASRLEDIVAWRPTPDMGHEAEVPYWPAGDYVRVRQYPWWEAPQQLVQLTERYRQAVREGDEVDSGATYQVSLGRVLDISDLVQADGLVSAGEWVLFSYVHAVYHGDDVFVRQGHRALLAVVSEDLIVREYGSEAADFATADLVD